MALRAELLARGGRDGPRAARKWARRRPATCCGYHGMLVTGMLLRATAWLALAGALLVTGASFASRRPWPALAAAVPLLARVGDDVAPLTESTGRRRSRTACGSITAC